ncbi:MAG: hypothetical protein FGM46_06510, partial [Ferruginibacter sp.]|nr:hypothetical protein [Ferruginibacter sp.]
KEGKEITEFANISYVNIPYTDISDSLVTVSDKDVEDYINKNKEKFKLEEEGRSISYIAFSQLPSSSDSLQIKNQLLSLKPEFEKDTNTKAFIAQNLSSIEFTDEFLPKEKIGVSIFDSLINLSPGAVYGPFVDQKGYILAKFLGSKNQPDSVKARHILIATDKNNPDSDKKSKQKADSLYAALSSGGDFGQIAAGFSEDPGSKDKGGDLGTFAYGTMVPEFNQFCFSQTPGTKGLVKTQFGYHIIEVLSHINYKPAYKIALLGKEINASDETVNNASNKATQASSEKTRAALEKYAKANGLEIISIPGLIKKNDFSAGALQDMRPMIKWAFDAKKGDVSESFNAGDKFVVALLDRVVPKGYQDAAAAKPSCESAIKNIKKAQIISQKLGKAPTLESAASTYSKQVLIAGADSTLTYSAQQVTGIGDEPKVIGASFNKNHQNQPSPLIEGRSGVFLLKVNSIQSKPAETPEALNQRISARTSALRNQSGNWLDGLRKLAEIKDNRSEHF